MGVKTLIHSRSAATARRRGPLRYRAVAGLVRPLRRNQAHGVVVGLLTEHIRERAAQRVRGLRGIEPRANRRHEGDTAIVDAVSLPWHDLRVLEIGAGCGAITRWLGRRAAAVIRHQVR